MKNEIFREELHRFSDWMANYYQLIEHFPVKSQVSPNEIFSKLENIDCLKQSEIQTILKDFDEILFPGITHWQSPNFFAYFPANTSPPSILAEMLTSALAQQCMIWETSPAAAELEEFIMIKIREMLGMPDCFVGSIQDTASTATLTALLMARERATNFSINENGFDGRKYRIYCSAEAHSSIEKAVKIAGFGKNNLVKITVDNNYAMNIDNLEFAIKSDIESDKTPLAVVSAFGTTGSTAIDPIASIGIICRKYGLFHHVDAALAGTALILPEFRNNIHTYQDIDSFVFNPHKWMFTNFDCSAFYVKDKDLLVNTFSINPEYLKTNRDDEVNNYRDWGIQLGRRFRALKLWFVIRYYGLIGLQEKIREHIRLAKWFASQIQESNNFELLAEVPLNTVCFRFHPKNIICDLNELNQRLLDKINSSGKIYITHTKLSNKFTLRFVVGQTNTQERNVSEALRLINEFAMELIEENH